MLARSLFIVGLAVVAAVEVPSYLSKRSVSEPGGEPVQSTSLAQAAVSAPGHARIVADGQGHFQARFLLNGKPVDGLVDTGATLIAFNQSTARQLGFGADSLDFKYPIATANGRTLAAHVELRTIEIGDIRLRDVDAFVIKDNALSTTLIGMSFLNQLSNYRVADGALEMER